MRRAEALAEQLLAIKAISLAGPDRLFNWASGIKSPIYCDNRLTMGYPAIRRFISESFAQYITHHYQDVAVIAGTATAGIPHAAWLADRLDKPMVYVRSSAKAHGKTNQIEGRLEAGQTVLLIEDLISTGGSSLAAARALRSHGAELLAVGAIFSYNFKEAAQNFKAASLQYFSLTDYQTLLPVALKNGYLSEADVVSLQAWSDNPRLFNSGEE